MSRRTYAPFAFAAVCASLIAATVAAQPPGLPPGEQAGPIEPPTILRIDTTYPLELLPVAATYQFGMVAAQCWYEPPGTQAGAAVASALPTPPQVALPTPAPTPVVTAAGLAQTVAGHPAPSPLDQAKLFSFYAGLFPQSGPASPVVVCPQPLPQVVCAGDALPCCAAKSTGLNGTWYREMPGTVVSVSFKGDELKVALTGRDGGTVVTVTLTADYSTTKDGTVHGVITGVDVDVAGLKNLDCAEIADVALKLQELVDQPFAFRCRSTEGGLMVSQLRIGKDREGCAELAMLLGMYKPAGCCGVPTPKSVAPVQVEVRGMCQPSPYTVQPGQHFAPPTGGVVVQRVVVEPPCPANVRVSATPCPVPAPPVAFTLPCPPPTICPGPITVGGPIMSCPPPNAPIFVGGPISMPVHSTPQFYPGGPVPAGFVVPPPPVMPGAIPQPVQRGLQGTWYREVGPAQCVFTFKNGQLTMTATMTGEEKGKSGTMGFLVTADYYITRDGNGIVGVITGVDVVLDGVAATDANLLEQVKDIGKLQKHLIGQPFALTYRLQEDVLMLGDLRVAFDKDTGLHADELMFFLTGRFKAAGPNGVPKAKAVAASECRGKACDVAGIEFKTVEAVPVMLPPVPFPQTGTVIPASGVEFDRCEPDFPQPILDGVRQGYLGTLSRS